MPITEYSLIQMRRGPLVDLPVALNTSEIGHALDERRLFIGNGTLLEGAPIVGNTEIITNYTLLSNPTALSWVYSSNTEVVAQTGPTSNAPVVRGIGQILDDRVSVKSFGAVGDGVTDDTAAINQALNNIYCVAQPGPYAAQMSYRELYFPAGVYAISDYIYLPPYCMIRGDGASRTIIKQTTSAKTAVFKTADSLFQNGAALGTNGATLPTNIHCVNIGFLHTGDQDIARLERASNVKFEKCSFTGIWTSGASTSSAVYLDKLGAIYTSSNIKFESCSFVNSFYAINIDTNGANANQIYFDICTFNTVNFGIYVNTGIVASDVKVANSLFTTITQTAFQCSSASVEMSSIGNTFNSCGDGSHAVLTFVSGATDCSSIGDKFISNSGANISDSGTKTIVLNNTNNFKLQNMQITPVQSPVTLLAAQTGTTTGITFTLSAINTIFIDYTMVRVVSAVEVTRIGRISIVSNGLSTGTVITDLFSDSSGGATGITFDYSIGAGALSILYTSSAGNSATWNIQEKQWLTTV